MSLAVLDGATGKCPQCLTGPDSDGGEWQLPSETLFPLLTVGGKTAFVACYEVLAGY